MLYFNRLITLLCILLMNISLAQATEVNTKFSAPGKMCFPQTSLYTQLEEFKSVMFEHYLIVSKGDHFKDGDVYVGFRLKSQPETLWLYDGGNWIKNDSNNVIASAFDTRQGIQYGQLQPIIPTSISHYPIDVSTYVGDGQLWVGYGLRSASGTLQESFDEMMSSGRFNLIWKVGEPLMSPGDLVDVSTICLSITEMTEIIPLIQTAQ